jgi:hypothetical protein
MISRTNPRRCQVSGCNVIVFELVYWLSGIGQGTATVQREYGSDNEYECSSPENCACACVRCDLA